MYTVLAFDFGASTGRAILGQYDGGKISYKELHRFDNVPIRENRRIAWDFFTLLKEVEKTIAACGKVDSLAFDTWGVDYGLLTEHDFLMSLPANYRDPRTNGIPEKVFEKISPGKLYRATGNQIMAINTLFQLMTEKGKALNSKTMLFMPDLFAWALCGCHSVDRTIASTSQMVNPLSGSWDQNITALTPFPNSFFPEIVECATVCGEYNGIPIVKVAGHDTQCAVAAMPWDGVGEAAFLSCGTWSLIGCELDHPILTIKSMADELSNEIGANDRINYLKNISGLWLIQEIRRNFRAEGKGYSYNDMEQLARKEPAFTCFIDPDAPEFAQPGNMPEKIRAYCEKTGQRVPQSDGALVRCIYESLSMKYRYAIAQLQENTGKRFEVLHLLGGGTKDTFLCQMTADTLGFPVIAGPTEATALGNIMLQLIALGAIKDVAEGRKLLRKTEKVTSYYPQKVDALDEKYQHFCEIICKQTPAKLKV